MGYQSTQKKLPLRKCMQCHKMKREAISIGRCQACYDANEMYENLIGWTDTTDTIPGLNDYVLYFLRWLKSRLSQRDRGPQGQSNIALIALMNTLERDMGMVSPRLLPPQGGSVIASAQFTVQEVADGLTALVRAMPSMDDFLPSHQPKDEPLPVERGSIELIACEVRYG